MTEENMNQEFRLKKIDEIRNYLTEEINRNELMSKKHKKVCRVLYKSVIKEKKKKHDKIVLLAKSKLDSIEVLISKALIDSNISHDEFYDMKEEIKNSNNK